MRNKTFSIRERTVLVPVELVGALKWTLIMIPAFFVLGGLGGDAGFWSGMLHYGLFAVLSLLGALVSGAVLTPILLPWLPGRAFSVKGFIMGLITATLFTAYRTGFFTNWKDWPEILAWVLLISSFSAYLGMNFTGASTYTSLSGVRKEMKWAVPLEIVGAVAGFCLWLGSRIVAVRRSIVMGELVYLKDVVTLRLDQEKCMGCGTCLTVCPHQVLAVNNGVLDIVRKDLCMECGACAKNCPVEALYVKAGVGCAAAVINYALGRKSSSCCCVIEPDDDAGKNKVEMRAKGEICLLLKT